MQPTQLFFLNCEINTFLLQNNKNIFTDCSTVWYLMWKHRCTPCAELAKFI